MKAKKKEKLKKHLEVFGNQLLKKYKIVCKVESDDLDHFFEYYDLLELEDELKRSVALSRKRMDTASYVFAFERDGNL